MALKFKSKPILHIEPAGDSPLAQLAKTKETIKPKTLPIRKIDLFALPQVPVKPKTKTVTVGDQPLTPRGLVDAKGHPIILDPSQYRVLETFAKGRHMVILGKAGTGKTTVVQALSLLYNQDNPDSTTSYRIRGKGEYCYAPKMAIIAYTNRATNNMAAKLSIHPILGEAFGYNITTGHNLLEYTVEFVVDPETGNTKRRYYPQRDSLNLLDIDILVPEEATMLGVGNGSLWSEIYDALPAHCRIVMLGDINQLPPVIGKPVLSYAIQSDKFDVVELTHVHRQALDNPIIKQAHNCLEGKEITTDVTTDPDGSPRGVKIFNGSSKTKLPWWEFQGGIMQVLNFYREQGIYDPMNDMVLSPYNKLSDNGAISAQGIAKLIAESLAKEHNRTVYEIAAGFQMVYLSVGDRVFYEKEDGIVSNISHNVRYMGKRPKEASPHMDYSGHMDLGHSDSGATDLSFISDHADDDPDYDSVSVAKLLEDVEELKEERKRTASHTVEITFADGRTATASAVGEFAELQLGYALSVHKAQGSEWPNVFVALHDSNNTMLYRELLYTAMTRPQKFLGIIAQPHILKKAQDTQRIKGNTLADKIEFFNGGYLDQEVPLDPAEKEQENSLTKPLSPITDTELLMKWKESKENCDVEES